MADLSSMYQMMLQATNPATWEANRQREMMGELEISEKQRQMEDDRKLRELFAKNQRPSVSDIGSISPAFAQKYSTEQFNLMNQQQQMEQRNQQMELEYGKVRAPVFGRVAEEYMQNVDSGMPEAQAKSVYNQQMGQAAAMLQQQNIPLPGNFKAEEHDPQMVLNNAAGLGYQSPYIKQKMDVQAEAAKRQLPPGRTPEQQYGRVEMGPYGPKVQPPLPDASLPSGGYRPGYAESVQQQYGQPEPESNIPAQDIDAFRAYKDSLPANSKERQAAEKALANTIKQNLPGSRFLTPEQERQLAIEEAGAKKSSELEATRKDSNKQAINAYFRLRPPQQISKLIGESIQGGGAKKINELANLIGVSIPGATPTSALEVIAQQMVASKPFPPGSQSEKELEARMKSIGDPSSEVPAEQRLAKFDEWLREQEALIAQEAELTPEELIDKVSEGYISKETAAKVYKRMHGGK
jgi:hypothetical protein